jgi:hypothetical protein
MPLWVWALAALVSFALLVAAAYWAPKDPKATLRAMSASESMSDEQARAVADNTVRVWAREYNANHLANVAALSCGGVRVGALDKQLRDLKKGEPIEPLTIAATGGFTRRGPAWDLNTLFVHGGEVFEMQVLGGRLYVCGLDSAPIP